MAGNSLKVDIAMDASGLVNGAKQATGAIKEISQEVSQADNSFKSIRSEINKQQSEVNKLANAYMQMRDKYGETSAAAIDYKTKLDSSVQSLAKLKAENEGVQNAIKQATQAIMQEGNAVQQSAQQIQSVSQRFEEIKNSGEPMKQQLRELKGLLAEMNFNGQGMSAEFNEVAQYAGKLRDAISDANTATNVFANDTQNLQAVIQSVQLVTAVFSALKGTMNMLGIENKNFEKTLIKVQSAMSTLISLQQIADLTNKNSRLVERLQITWYKVKDAVLKAQTVSLKANTAAQAINTAGTKFSTIAQNAWNVAKAVAKALIGDFTGLLIVGAVALTTYALATSDSTDELDNQTNALEKNSDAVNNNSNDIEHNKEKQKEWANDIRSSISEQLKSYFSLQQKWKECNGDVKLQGKFMNAYKSEINNLGLSIYSLIDAEKAFVKYTDNVVAAIVARKAAEKLGEKLAEQKAQWALEDATHGVADKTYMPTVHKELTHGANSASGTEMQAYERTTGRSAITGGGGQSGAGYVLSDDAQKWITEYRRNTYRQERKQLLAERKQSHAREEQIINDARKNLLKEADNNLKGTGLKFTDYSSATGGGGAQSAYSGYGHKGSSGGRHGNSGGRHGNSSTPKTSHKSETTKDDPDANTKGAYQKRLQEINKLLQDRNLSEIEHNKLLREKVDLEDKVKDIEEKQKKAEASIRFSKEIKNQKIQLPTVEVKPIDTKKLVNIDDYKKSLYDAGMQSLNHLQDLYDAGIIVKNKFLTQWDSIVEALKQKGIIVNIKPELEMPQWQKQLNNAADAVKQLGDAFSSMGEAFELPALNIAGTIAQAIANIWMSYSQAMAQAASLGPWAWIGFGAAALGQVIGIISAMKSNKYAQGGIVTGNSTVGDKLYARLNGGEMILNDRQQAHLMNIVNGAPTDGNSGMGGTVVFEVKGDRLYGVLNNYNKKKQLVGKNIGIK